LVMGDKEAQANAVSVRTRGKGDQGSKPLDEFITASSKLLKEKSMDL
jgi:threonyl-tRNA synthetase